MSAAHFFFAATTPQFRLNLRVYRAITADGSSSVEALSAARKTDRGPVVFRFQHNCAYFPPKRRLFF